MVESMKSIALYYSENACQEEQNEQKEVNNVQTTEPAKVVEEESSTHTETDEVQKKDKKKKKRLVELHLNIWKVEEGTVKLYPRFYIDFGIMFPKEYRQLCLYLPFEIEGEPINLSEYLTGSENTLSVVFNADTRTWAHGNPNYYNVVFQDDPNRAFHFYKLGAQNFKKTYFDGKKPDGGFFLKLLINGDLVKQKNKNDIDSDNIYVRFRLKLAKNSSFVRTEKISNDLLQAAFSSTDLIDIRVNESRVLNTKIREQMDIQCFKACEFEKVHLFYMVDTRENVDNGSSLKQDTRIVEQEQWDKYLPPTSLYNTTFVAYHWKKRRKDDGESIKTFNVFFSTIYPKTNMNRLAAYCFVVIFLGFMGSMLSFHVLQLSCNYWVSWVRPVILIAMSLFVIGYFVKQNFGGKKAKIYRKRC